MELRDREFFVYRIALGYTKYQVEDICLYIHEPILEELEQAQEVYLVSYQEAVVENVYTDQDILEIMRDKIDGGRIISIDLFSMEQLGKDTYLSDDIGGFALLWSRFAKRLRGSRAPKLLLSFTDLILRCMDIITVHLDASSVDLVDLHVKPSLHEYSPGQWEAAEEIEAIGYQQTKARLTDWE